MKSANLMTLVALTAVSVMLAIIACGPSVPQYQFVGDGAVDRTPESGSAVPPGSKYSVQATQPVYASWPTRPSSTSVSKPESTEGIRRWR